MAQSLETIHRVIVVSEERGLTQTAAKTREYVGELERLKVASEGSDKSTENLGRTLERVLKKHDPLHKDMVQLGRDLKDIAALEAAGLTTTEKAIALRAAAAAKTAEAQAGAKQIAAAEAEAAKTSAARAAAIAGVTQSLTDQIAKLRLTANEYEKYNALLKAGTTAATPEGRQIVSHLDIIQAEREAQKQADAAAKEAAAHAVEAARQASAQKDAINGVNRALEDQIARLRLTAAEYEKYSALQKAGTTASTPAGRTIVARLEAIQAEREAQKQADAAAKDAAALADEAVRKAAAQKAAIDGVNQSLVDQIARLHLTSNEYEKYSALLRAGTTAGTPEGQRIVSQLESIQAERDVQKQADAAAKDAAAHAEEAARKAAAQKAAIDGVNQSLVDQIARLRLTAGEYEKYAALQRAGTTGSTPEGQAIVSRIDFIQRERAAQTQLAEANKLAERAASDAAKAYQADTRFLNEMHQQADAAGAALKRLGEQQTRINRLLAEGRIEKPEAEQMLAGAEKAAQRAGKGIGLAYSETQNLKFQLNDILSGLMAGQSPFTVIVQQGGQVYQILDGPRGVTQGLKNAGAWLVSLITPARVAGAALVGTAALAIYAWNRFDNAQKEVLRTLDGIGRGVGLTIGQFNALNEAAAGAGGMSIARTRDLTLALANTGQLINPENMVRMAAAAKTFAATWTGGDIDAANKKMAELVKSGPEGIAAWGKEQRLFNIDQRVAIEQAVREHDINKAISILLGSFKDQTADHNKTVGELAKAWERIKNSVTNLIELIGPFLDRGAKSTATFVENSAREIAGIVAAVEKADRFIRTGTTAAPASQSAYRPAPKESYQAGGMVGDTFDANTKAIEAAANANANLAAKLKEVSGAQTTSAGTTQASSERLALQTRILEDSRKEIQGLINEMGNADKSDEGRGLVTKLVNTKEALQSGNVEFRQRVIDSLAAANADAKVIESADAVTAAQKKQAEATKEIGDRALDTANQVTGENKSYEDKKAALDTVRKAVESYGGANKEVSAVLAETASKLQQSVESQTEGGKRLTQAQIEQMRIDLQRRALNIDLTETQRAQIVQDQKRLELIGQEITVQDAANRENAVGREELEKFNQARRGMLRDQGYANEQLALEKSLLFASNAERAAGLAALQKEQELRRSGTDTTTAQSKAIIAEAAAAARAREEFKLYQDAVQTARGAVTEFAQSFVSDMMNGVKASEALANSLKKVGQSLTNTGISTAVKGLATQNYAQAGIGAAEVGIGLILQSMGPSKKHKERLDQIKKATEEQAKAVEDAQALIGIYLDRLARSTSDTSTIGGALRVAELDAQKLRAEAAKAGGQAIVLAEQIISVNRQKIIDDFAKQAVAAEEEIAKRRMSFQDRVFAAANDNNTLEGRLAAYDRQAQREREDEVRAGGQALTDLEAAQYAERAKIIRDYADQAIAEEKRRYDEARQFLDQFAKTIKQFVDNLKAGAQSPLSPADRLTQARAQYNTQLASAQSGNRDALSGITNYATNLLDAGKAFYASSKGFQDIYAQVTQDLTALPGQVSPEQLIVNELKSQTNSLSTILSNIDKDGDGMISRQEASNTFLNSIFREIDTNDDGMLDKMELIKYATQGTKGGVDANVSRMDTANALQSTANQTLDAQKSILAQIQTNSAQLAVMQGQNQEIINRVGITSRNAARTASNTYYSGNKDGGTGGTYLGDFSYARGGWVNGPGTSTSDSIAAQLSNGEFVVNAASARVYGPMLESMNRGAPIALPMPVGNDNSAVFGALIREVQALRNEVVQLRAENTRATIAAAEHVREGVDGVRESHDDLVRETKLRNAA